MDGVVPAGSLWPWIWYRFLVLGRFVLEAVRLRVPVNLVNE